MLDGDLDNQVPLEETRKVATLFPDSTFVTITGPGHLTVAGAGVVFKVDKSGNETVLYTFTGGADGAYPLWVVLAHDPAGNLYGTTANGGASNAGVVFKVDKSGNETVLHSFTGGIDGGNPYVGLVRDSVGKLYGTTAFGGQTNAGVVFEIKP